MGFCRDNADIEFGGMVQKFNIFCGRDLEKENKQEQQIAIFMPLLMGVDGRKMSKSFNNHIPVLSEPKEKFRRIMSIKDEFIMDYLRYTTNVSKEKLMEIESSVHKRNPRDIKMFLAKELIKRYHTEEDAISSEQEFINIFSNKGIPEDFPKIRLTNGKYKICSILKEYDLTTSISESKRLIKQGGLRIDGEKILDDEQEFELNNCELIIKAGKRKFLKFVSQN